MRYWSLITAIIGLTFLVADGPAATQEPHRAALVVQVDEATTISRCVEFTEESISGYDLLARSGLNVEADFVGMGATICRIKNTGCPADDCFCHCRGDDCVYWSYWQQVDGAWRYGQRGASLAQVSNGVVEGWSWGPGSVTNAIAPPPVTFADVCQGDLVVAGGSEPSAVSRQRSVAVSYLLFGLLAGGLMVALLLRRRRGPQ